ncbi:MAG: hypothetical protein IK152_08890 [Lachnospiraceae bacterium]|nr:hypothetical protein [Lachnospiraceae bacterium]
MFYYVSEIRDGVPWTKGDEALLTDLPKEDQDAVLDWIDANIRPRKTPTYEASSYGIKHIMHDDNKIYTTNNQFKHAMLIKGYQPVEEHRLNWNYCISRKSPAFDYKSRGYLF